jgi:cysteine-rich repeat protein
MRHTPLAFLLGLTLVASVRDATVVLDETTAGTVSDGIIDGFPGLAPKDGDPDFGGNPLSVALRADVTELRSVMEVPLAPLAGVAPSSITSATLTFNVDDVISTFGPNTTFNGMAADAILVHLYDGDGQAVLGDFRRTGEAPVPVPTGPAAITDATLDTTGAIFFDVDVKARLVQALTAGTPFLGILWRTTDSPTATSIDAGTPGQMPGEGNETAAGSRMPFLTIEIADAPASCEAGDPCDDGNPCTADRCEPAVGCVNEPGNDGASCDDGTACTVGDACAAGACVGTGPCGDGVPDTACGEECDDGNAAGGDGCDAACRYDALLGGTGPRECLLRLAFVGPERLADGSVAPGQSCTDGDASCDATGADGFCAFRVAACVGQVDARLPACLPIATATTRAKPQVLASALSTLVVPGCTKPVRVDVPVRRRGARTRPGKLRLVLNASAPGVGKDRDSVRLLCRPAP